MARIRISKLHKESWISISLWFLSALLFLRLLTSVVSGLDRPRHGFVSHYTASRLLLEGESVARYYDVDWFRSQVKRFEPTVVDLHGANLPTMSLIVLPLASFEYRTARAIWSIGSLVVLALSMILVLHLLNLGGVWAPAFLCFGLVSQPVHENLLHGQLYVFALALIVIAWLGYRWKKGAVAGSALGVLFISKSAGLMLWPMFLAQRWWRVFLWGAGSMLVVVASSLPWIGTAAWSSYFKVAAALPSEPGLSVTAYQTVLSFCRHLFVYDANWNPEPVLDLAALGTVFSWVALAALLGTGVIVASKREATDSIFASFVLLSLILSPVSLDYHYVIALLPIAILLAKLSGRMGTREGLLLIVGALMIGGDLPYRAAQLTEGYGALFAYPKLYGALILWWLTLVSARSQGRPQ